ncbi:MAG: HypC/HybG/HupF family hydrogenase formation chaperone [Candidatus Lokiarchaeota archaeon]|nr:HypC/HybG/HupF family hydrogenase formation chaperone [Candidatus Lokiarchaeota archaeon]
MCLAIPAKVLEIDGDVAKVDFGGIQKKVFTTLIDSVEIGEYVIVHAGYAIEVQTADEAEETLKMMNDYVEEHLNAPDPDP